MEFKDIVIINGKKTDSKNSIILDQGLNFGQGVFETIAVVGKSPMFLDKHCERMKKGLSALGINNRISEELITSYIRRFAIKDCAMKVLVTPENIVVSTRENIYSSGPFKDGFKVGISSLKRNPHSHVVYHKTLNFTDNIIEKNIVRKSGFDEAVFFNVYGRLAEGSVSNIFFVKENRLCTPAVKCGLLAGIIRDWVLKNYTVEEEEYTLEQLMDADEVFLTNSLMGIMPVRELQGKAYDCPGRKCSEIQKRYKDIVNKLSVHRLLYC